MEDFFVGEIIMVPYTFAPYGTLYCDGQEYPVQEYQTLFSLLGYTFGGNGSSKFCVPNLKGFEPHPGIHYVIAIDGYYPERN